MVMLGWWLQWGKRRRECTNRPEDDCWGSGLERKIGVEVMQMTIMGK